jgi:hypothetical protein
MKLQHFPFNLHNALFCHLGCVGCCTDTEDDIKLELFWLLFSNNFSQSSQPVAAAQIVAFLERMLGL